MEDQSLSYILNHLGEERENYFGAVAPPLIQTTNFAYNSVSEFRNAILEEKDRYLYTRGNNPTVEILRKKLAALQGTEDALVFGSGAAAVASAVMPFLKAGDHVVCIHHVYSWTGRLFNNLLSRYGIEATFVEGVEASDFEPHIRENTTMIYLESPNSHMMQMQNVEDIVDMARTRGLMTVMDNSYGSPLSRKPVEWGVDLIVHSGSKYIGGHSDSIAGVVCGSRELMGAIFSGEFMTLGGIVSPFNAWLMLRSLRTLPIRLQRASENAMKVVAFLKNHPLVEALHWPFDPDHPQYHLAIKQMEMPMPLLSFQLLTASTDMVEKFCDSLKVFLLAASWGSFESLVLPAIVFPETSYPKNNIRLYIGLEDPKELVEDLEQAFAKIS